MDLVITKICSGCKVDLPLTSEYFNSDKSHNSGFRSSCKTCSKKQQSLNRRNHRDNGICSNCSEPKLHNNATYCLKHWLKYIAAKNLGSSKYWIKLKELTEKQNYKCIYTGEQLIPSVNISLDHKYPQSRYPDIKFDINNVQWVTFTANISKGTMTHFEFINFCRIVCNNHSKLQTLELVNKQATSKENFKWEA